ncbi:MAG: class I SAM-dependent methyltransferase [Candidatus Nitrosotenuis sp.]
MKKAIHDAILEHYTELYYKHGVHPAAIGWPKGRQNIRFQVMTEIGNMKNSKILDVGCGFGDLLSFFKFKKIRVNYTGVDINPIFVKIAKQRHPKAIFQVRDIEKERFRDKFDWVFAVGTTNMAGSHEYITNLLTEMLRIAKKGVAMDFMSTYVDFKRPKSFHASPERVFQIGKKLSKRVVVRHDYLPFEFCIYIYKNDILMENQTFVDFPVS